MKLSWQNITVGQFQDVFKLNLDPTLDDMGKVEKTICILFDLTEKQVEEMEMTKFSDYARQCAFVMSEPIPGKVKKYIRAGNKKYSVCYKPSKLKHRQFVEIVTFGEKPVENMHKLMASLVKEVKWFGLRELPNKAENHEQTANELLNASVVDVYHACVFFCDLFRNSIEGIRDFLEAEMTKKGMTKEQAKSVTTDLQAALDGYSQQHRSQNMKK